MDTEPISSFEFPPGFRFHPSDEELIIHYLLNKLNSRPLPASVIAEIELYNYNPWELPKKALFGENEWYFFSPRDRKYPNGVRPNRTAASGYWKATGTDKPIISSSGSKRIGVKKALVFYSGRPPKGVKTEWIMNEYRLPGTTSRQSRLKESMRLDDWVLCRVRQKGNMSKNAWEVQYNTTPSKQVGIGYLHQIEELPSAYTDTTTTPDINLTDFNFPKDCTLLASLLAGQNVHPIQTVSATANSHNSFINATNNSGGSVYGNGSGKMNTTHHLTNSLFEGFFNPSKGKTDMIHSTKTTNNGKNDDAVPRNMMLNDGMSFYNQNRARGDIFKANPLITFMNLQELTDSAFLEKYLG
ncbi:unnamed protein product [Ilex paraguariensis]|uniref:NAC domain-containing protein n=1 Tax=Ilex paraguariensis TaxID=185542 RepID=A0ABC8TYA8_9AQUA